ncbi:MAG: Regulatory protein RecX [Legionellaceae bacterium]
MTLHHLRQKALSLLARREYSCKELEQKLFLKANVKRDLVKQLINQLIEENLLSDTRFTEVFIHSRIRKGYGPIRIREELKQKGISLTLIDQYLDQTEEKWQSLLAKVWEKRFSQQAPKDFNEFLKQAHFLQYRGFEPAKIRTFLKQYFSFSDC